jgi:transposase
MVAGWTRLGGPAGSSLRLAAADLIESGAGGEVAQRFRVSRMSMNPAGAARWLRVARRRAAQAEPWAVGQAGDTAVLEAGSAAYGWDEDQGWTLARVTELVRRRFKVEYTLAGIDMLMHRIGGSVPDPRPNHNPQAPPSTAVIQPRL